LFPFDLIQWEEGKGKGGALGLSVCSLLLNSQNETTTQMNHCGLMQWMRCLTWANPLELFRAQLSILVWPRTLISGKHPRRG